LSNRLTKEIRLNNYDWSEFICKDSYLTVIEGRKQNVPKTTSSYVIEFGARN